MHAADPVLEHVRIASPCPADWDKMPGTDRARFCTLCSKHVYNLSGMTRTEATRLIRTHEGQICVRLARRPDGTVITDDCPVGWAAVQRRISRMRRMLAAGLTLAIGIVTGCSKSAPPTATPEPIPQNQVEKVPTTFDLGKMENFGYK